MNYPNRKMTIACAVCDTSKKEANHWHELFAWLSEDNEVLVLSLGPQTDGLAWRPNPNLEPTIYDVCGENCLHRQIDPLRGISKPPEGE